MLTSALLAGAALVGQFASPQAPHYAAPPPAAPQAVQVLLVQQPAPKPAAPSILVQKPPVWDRALERLGHYLVARADAHTHPTPLKLVQASPAIAQAPTVQYVQMMAAPAPTPAAGPIPTPSAQSEAAPPAPSIGPAPAPFFLVPDPDRENAVKRLFGR